MYEEEEEEEAFSNKFIETLERLATTEPRIYIRRREFNVDSIWVDGGKKHSYSVYAGLTKDSRLLKNEWRSFASLMYYGLNDNHTVMHKANMPSQDYEMVAEMVFLALENHILSGFREP